MLLFKYILYRYHVYRKSPDQEWDALNKDTSRGALQKIQELRGFYIKSGQLAASNVGDALYVATYTDISWPKLPQAHKTHQCISQTLLPPSVLKYGKIP